MGLRVELDGLVRRVVAGHVALPAIDALLLVHQRHHLLLDREVAPRRDPRQGPAQLVLQAGHPRGLRARPARHVLRRQQIRLLQRPRARAEALRQVRAELGAVRGRHHVLDVAEAGGSVGEAPGRRGLARPACAGGLPPLQVQQRLEAGDVVLHDREVLVLDGGADLHDAGPAVHELQGVLGRLHAARAHDGEARERARDAADLRQRHRAVGAAAHPAVRGLLGLAHAGPGGPVGVHGLQALDGVDGRHAVGAPRLRRPGDGADVRDVGRQLREERDLDGRAHPPADVAHEALDGAARQPHAPLAHAVGAAQVQLQRVGPRGLGPLRQLRPVRLVQGAHDGRDDDVVGVVRDELPHDPAPVVRALVGDELDVGERGLAGAVDVAAGGPPDDPRRHVGDQVLVQAEGLRDAEGPAGLEPAADHLPRRGGRRGRQAERVLELQAQHLDADVHVVDGAVEQREPHLRRDGAARGLLQALVHVPARGLPVVGGLDRHRRPDEVPAREQPGDAHTLP